MKRDNEWDSLTNEVPSFCTKYEIIIPNTNDKFATPGRPLRRFVEITNLHHYQVELFYTTIDMQLQELKNIVSTRWALNCSFHCMPKSKWFILPFWQANISPPRSVLSNRVFRNGSCDTWQSAWNLHFGNALQWWLFRS